MQEYNTHHFQNEVFKYSLLYLYALSPSLPPNHPLTVSVAPIGRSDLTVFPGKPTRCGGTLGPVLTLCKIKLFTNKF